MNDPALAVCLATAPSVAFAELKERPRFWFPLVLMIVASCITVGWYYSVVDVPWLADQIVNSNERLANMNESMRSRMLSSMTATSMTISGVFSVAIAVPLMCALFALYYLIAGKVAGLTLSFKHWFTMMAWCSLPALIGSVAAWILLATERSPVQITPDQLQTLSLNELYFHIPFGKAGSSLFGSLSILTALSWALTTVCVHTWSNRSWVSSATFALLPSVVMYGFWAWLAFR